MLTLPGSPVGLGWLLAWLCRMLRGRGLAAGCAEWMRLEAPMSCAVVFLHVDALSADALSVLLQGCRAFPIVFRERSPARVPVLGVRVCVCAQSRTTKAVEFCRMLAGVKTHPMYRDGFHRGCSGLGMSCHTISSVRQRPAASDTLAGPPLNGFRVGCHTATHRMFSRDLTQAASAICSTHHILHRQATQDSRVHRQAASPCCSRETGLC